MMRVFNVTANLMSLGAIDFGIVVDGSIVILEGILAHIYGKQFRGRTLTRKEMDKEVEKGASGVTRSATFAVLIILIVFFPILTLNGIEGKYFTPMAKTLVFCIVGALILSLTLSEAYHCCETHPCRPLLRETEQDLPAHPARLSSLQMAYRHHSLLRADRFTFSLYPPGSRVHSHFGRR